MTCCLLLLDSLHAHLLQEVKLFKESMKGFPERGQATAPPLSPDTLSIKHQKVLTTVLQFIVSLGICPYLAPGVGIPLELRSGFGQVLAKPISLSTEDVLSRLYEVVHTLLSCVTVPSIGGIILTRHVGDIMSSLLQILHQPPCPAEGTDKDLSSCQSKDVLAGVMGTSGEEDEISLNDELV